MIGTILMTTGLVLAIGSIVAGIWLMHRECVSDDVSECAQSTLELLVQLMKSGEGTVFWALVALGFVLISVGHTIRANQKNHSR